MNLITRLILIVACFTAAFTAGTLAHSAPAAAAPAAHAAPAFYGLTPGQVSSAAASLTGTPAQDNAACVAVYHFHHVATVDQLHSGRAWRHAWHLAGYADTLAGDSMRYNIRHYLLTDHGWSLVAGDCYPDA